MCSRSMCSQYCTSRRLYNWGLKIKQCDVAIMMDVLPLVDCIQLSRIYFVRCP